MDRYFFIEGQTGLLSFKDKLLNYMMSRLFIHLILLFSVFGVWQRTAALDVLPAVKLQESARYEWLVGYAESPLFKTDKPSFNYINAEVRKLLRIFSADEEPTPYYMLGSVWLGRPVGDFGTAIVGAYLGIRRDWQLLDDKLAIYLEAHLGGLLSDAYRDRDQRLVGNVFSFHEDLRIGVRSQPRQGQYVGFFCEIGIQHISNAGISSRNSGVNSITLHFGIQI